MTVRMLEAAELRLLRLFDFLLADPIRLVRMVNKIGRLTATKYPPLSIPPPKAEEWERGEGFGKAPCLISLTHRTVGVEVKQSM
jgi:hypothetical protein